jgi:hypothetical protein
MGFSFAKLREPVAGARGRLHQDCIASLRSTRALQSGFPQGQQVMNSEHGFRHIDWLGQKVRSSRHHRLLSHLRIFIAYQDQGRQKDIGSAVLSDLPQEMRGLGVIENDEVGMHAVKQVESMLGIRSDHDRNLPSVFDDIPQ